MTDILTVEIPADVLGNSETTTDYAFMRHRSNFHVFTPGDRDRTIRVTNLYLYGYRHYQWDDIDPNGQLCRFDMIVNREGSVVNLFHTQYWTRVACATGDFCYSYATHYALVIKDGEPTTDGPLPYCDEHLRTLSRELTVVKSERLRIGQHD